MQRLLARCLGVPSAIGFVTLLSQLASAQAPTPGGAEGWATVEARDDFLTARMRAAFSGRDVDLGAGWDAAATLGPSVSPALWRLLDGQSTGEARLAVLAAIQAAGGVDEDDRLLRWNDSPGRSARDRLFVAFVLAMGPRRSAPHGDLLARLRGTSELAELLALLAAARFPGVEGLPDVASDGDPGIAGAALFAGSVFRSGPPRGARHEGLFWRGALLGAVQPPAKGALREHARTWATDRGDGAVAIRRAALWWQARAGDAEAWLERPDDEALAILVGEPAARARLRSWLASPPQARTNPVPAIVVAQAMACPLTELVATREGWAVAAEHRAGVLVLAMRALTEGGLPCPPAWPAVSEWALVRLACGSGDQRLPPLADANLARAAAAFATGRLPAADFADALELAVWRAGAHPGLAPWRLERDFLRDLVLAGSQEGGGKYQPHVPPSQRYFATGLGRDEPWFRVAVAFFEWHGRLRGTVPAALRLVRRN